MHAIIATTLLKAGINITCANMFSRLLNQQGNNVPEGDERERIPNIAVFANPAT